jgi:hypothetical protein
MTWTGSAFTENGMKIQGRQFIREFPWTPKSFYIDVIGEETAKDDWTFYICDGRQLDAAWKIYYRK